MPGKQFPTFALAGSSADEQEVRRTGSERRPGRLTCRDRSARDAAPHLRRVRIGTVPGPARAGRRPASSPKRAPQPRSLHRPSKRAGKKAHPHPRERRPRPRGRALLGPVADAGSRLDPGRGDSRVRTWSFARRLLPCARAAIRTEEPSVPRAARTDLAAAPLLPGIRSLRPRGLRSGSRTSCPRRARRWMLLSREAKARCERCVPEP